ncbi:FMN reductase [Streptomyces sp. 2132.2]|uniref:FMN reductase n=1 Tax=Streptomyces sp. 2132.2 TaxID=2485161 RepID=UPI000F47855F|nr:FMN reductase [Streptomyces sp. 2132.2]ROR00343.1 FMN reductase [Streptomyces sp. 2132.2]
MSGARRLVAVCAGLSLPSSTRLLADRLAESTARQLEWAAPSTDVEITVVELRQLAVDISKHLVTGFPPPALRAALDTVTGADGLIVVTPVFNACYSGLFKSFFDLVERGALEGKPVLAAATGGTARHSLALEYAVRPLFTHLRAQVTPTVVFAAPEDWGSAGGAGPSAGLATRVVRAGGELAHLVMGTPPLRPEEAEVVPFEEQLAALRPDRG